MTVTPCPRGDNGCRTEPTGIASKGSLSLAQRFARKNPSRLPDCHLFCNWHAMTAHQGPFPWRNTRS